MHFKHVLAAIAFAAPLILAAPRAHDAVAHHKRFSPAHELGVRAEHAKRNDMSPNSKSRWRNRRRANCVAPPSQSSSTSVTPPPASPTPDPPAYTPPPAEQPQEPQEPQQPPNDPPPSTPAPNQNAQDYLDVHNTARANHGANPLSWADDLAATAQTWANGCDFKHSGGSLGPFGENLSAGTGTSVDARRAVQMWVDEEPDYDPNNPTFSHYTQVVWKGTTQVGCAVANCPGGSIFDASYGSSQFYVCEYRPAGNVIGHFAENVG